MSEISKTLLAAEAALVSGLMGCQSAPVEQQQTNTTSATATSSDGILAVPVKEPVAPPETPVILRKPDADPGHLQALMGVIETVYSRCEQVLSKGKEETLDFHGLQLPIRHYSWGAIEVGDGVGPTFNPWKYVPLEKVYDMADGDRFDLDCSYGMSRQYGLDSTGSAKRLQQSFEQVDASHFKTDYKLDITALEEKGFELYVSDNINPSLSSERIIAVEKIGFEPGVERKWVVAKDGDQCSSTFTLKYLKSHLVEDNELKPTIEKMVPIDCDDYDKLRGSADSEWGRVSTQIETFLKDADKKPSSEGPCAGKKNCVQL